MNDIRPVNLDLTTVKFPITAIASILHRICAVISWVGLGLLLAALCMALASQASYDKLAGLLQASFLAQFFTWGFLTAFGYYCLATAKHIIQDLGFFEDFASGRFISWLVIVVGVALSVLIGVWLWA
ncbi:MAG: succinate dehydrogenase, cytochrome b556 subunit [Cellvibrionaceae bacterium]|nr:succinate dehydrogenase, cytochrome b556 subunit [Cellvibrionaceae bacterium]